LNATKIDWADTVWNPVWGCNHGCAYCYARKFAKRYGKKIAGRTDFVPTWIDKNYTRPMPKKAARIFVNSMSDIACWQPEWLGKVTDRIKQYPQHSFLFLTKRPEIYKSLRLPANCWLGATATTEDEASRAAVEMASIVDRLTFLSLEPIGGLIRPGTLYAWGTRWVIVGAETGNRAGKVVPKREWIEAIRKIRPTIALFEKESLRGLMGELVQEFPA
jgi:protein gp37